MSLDSACDFACDSVCDSACGSIFSDLEEYEIDMPSIQRGIKESFYHKYNNGKYLSSYDYFSKPPSTYYVANQNGDCLLYTSPSPRDGLLSRMPSSA